MKNNATPVITVPSAPEAIRVKCFHPSGDFTKFAKEDVESSIPDRFDRICRLYPEQIAVKAGAQTVTYSELNVRANRIARAILAQQGGNTKPVGLLLEKGASLMAAMLGVLKAGQFFMLLDASFPKARNAALLEDSGARLVILDRENLSLAQDLGGRSVSLMELESLDLKISSDNPDLRISPEAFAAIVYTSGSTGEPKGVIWNHRDLLHRTMLRTIENQASEQDRIALLPTGTANTVTNSFFALLNGATICPFAVNKEGVIRLAMWLSEEGITICPFSASLFRSLTAVLSGYETFPHLRVVRLRSETVHKRDFEHFKRHFPSHCAFVTGLSCSEAGQLTTCLLNHQAEIPDGSVPIGYPVQDKEILLLDDAGNEVGINQVGEIVVRSRYLAVGYWRRPELTAAKFRSDPNGREERLCYTGDLGLRLPDGCLVHKGRKDFRVKIRGYGVELAEVERCLLDHSDVREAVVVTRKPESNDVRLVAYFTAHNHANSTTGELKNFLGKKLPNYMIPSAFMRLDAMPLTSNGKVDRRALPDPGKVRPDLATAYLSPRNTIEQKLVSIWEDVLDIQPVGVNDSFFDLGGDSLSATRVLSQIITHFKLDISFQTLFNSPTLANLAAVVAQHHGKILGNGKAIQSATVSLFHHLQENLLPLSHSQQRLWFLDQLNPGNCTYNLFSAYRLKGKLNVSTLERSFNEIVRRHDIMRTVFRSNGGSPVQLVLRNLTITIPVFDLRAIVSEEDKWAEAHRRFTEEAQRPFDIATGPLLRITLLQLADEQYVLLRAMHHIVSDGWSEGVLFRELSEIYAALATGKTSPLADLPTQYADYAKWQRQWFEGERLKSQLSYWKKQLDNVATLQLPTDRPRQGLEAACGARRYFAFSDGLSSELKKLSRQHGATLFMTLLGAFQTLLHRYSNQTDIAVGSPVAGRSRSEFEELIGLFLNMLVLRLDLSGNPTFTETITRVREVCLAALSNQELPFEKLVEELHPDRHPGRNPLFQVSFAFQNTPRVPPRLSGITVEELEVETGITRFDLHLFMEETDEHLKGYCDYDTNLFNADTIERMLGHFQTLLEGIVADPEQPISELPLLTQAEKHQLLVDWNDTKTDYPKDKCIHTLFEEQVEKTPDAVALIFGDQQLTYRELNQRANQLANYLVRLGVCPEVLVGICLERSVEMIVALVAILKAGGAYVPLDASYPTERLALMLADSKAVVVLTQELFADLFPNAGTTIVCLNTERDNICKEKDTNLALAIPAHNLAYVLYTSGSTGTPKGVAVEHRSTLAFVSWALSVFAPEDCKGVLAATSICFDLSVFEIFATLSCGGTIVLAQNALALAHLRAAGEVTLINTVPSAIAQLVKLRAIPPSVRVINLAGEPLQAPLVQQIYESSSVDRINDLYGPTECTTYSTWTCRRSDSPQTIGRPIANTQIYILDSHLAPAPIGVPGEIVIGGAGLARGYLNRRELTEEKFIANPFSNEPGARLYKTGDLARYLPDGNIQFLGRNDHQVKIRGHRIEPGEIEAVLSEHPAVREVTVVARAGAAEPPNSKRENANLDRLAAYIVSRPQYSLAVEELRAFLKRKLPAYMVPSAFISLDELPLTPNGKVDRRALPDACQSASASEKTFVAPRTPAEKAIADIWMQVLRRDSVGVGDNFFDLGGHSLLATQVISRVRESFGLDITLAAFFERPTIEDLASLVSAPECADTEGDQVAETLAHIESLTQEEVEAMLKTGSAAERASGRIAG